MFGFDDHVYHVEIMHFKLSYGTFPLQGAMLHISLFWGGGSLGTVPGTFFSTTSVEVPSEPYRYQNVMCKVITDWPEIIVTACITELAT